MINSEKDSLSIPDYSAFINTLTIQSKELEDSYAIQRQITAPTEEWVITRLGRVADVANIDPVTEENDPNGNLNKPGGYTSTVYFGTALLGTQNLSGNPLIDEGTDAGGAVETYRTAEEAETRNNYLASFDGAGDEARLGFAPRSENSVFKPKGLVAPFLRYPDYLTSFVSSVRKSAELGTGFQPVTTSLHYLL